MTTPREFPGDDQAQLVENFIVANWPRFGPPADAGLDYHGAVLIATASSPDGNRGGDILIPVGLSAHEVVGLLELCRQKMIIALMAGEGPG